MFFYFLFRHSFESAIYFKIIIIKNSHQSKNSNHVKFNDNNLRKRLYEQLFTFPHMYVKFKVLLK